MDRYEKLRSLAIKAQNLAREIALTKDDFEAQRALKQRWI